MRMSSILKQMDIYIWVPFLSFGTIIAMYYVDPQTRPTQIVDRSIDHLYVCSSMHGPLQVESSTRALTSSS